MFTMWVCIFITSSLIGMDSSDRSAGLSNAARSYSTIRYSLTSSGKKRYCYKAGSSAREDKESESIVVKFNGLERRDNAFCAIFDGHNGKETATIAAQRLPERLRTISRNPVDHLALWWACVDTEFQDIRQVKKEGMACKDSGACFAGAYFDKKICHLLWLGNVRAIVSRKGVLIGATQDQVLNTDMQRQQQMIKFRLLSVARNDIKQTNGCTDKFMLVPYTASFGDVRLKGIEPSQSPRKKEHKGSRLSVGSSVSDDHSSSSADKKTASSHLEIPKNSSDSIDPLLHNEPGYLPVELESGDLIVIGSPGLWYCANTSEEESEKSVDINVQIATQVWNFLKPIDSSLKEKETSPPFCPDNKSREFQLEAAARYLREAASEKLAGKEGDLPHSKSFIRGKTFVPRCSPSVIVIEYTTHVSK